VVRTYVFARFSAPVLWGGVGLPSLAAGLAQQIAGPLNRGLRFPDVLCQYSFIFFHY
jgi:hypothetical protein